MTAKQQYNSCFKFYIRPLLYRIVNLFVFLAFTFLVTVRAGAHTIVKPDFLTEEEKAWILANPVITATNKMEMGPFDFVEGGEATGYSIDYINLLALKAGLEIKYINGLPWTDLLEQMKDKKIDLTHSLFKSPERSKYLDFTKPFLKLPWAYYGKVGSDQIKSLNDLEGKSIGLLKGSIPWEIYLTEYPNLKVIEYSSSIEALNDLSTGHIEVYVNLLPVTNFRIKRNMINGVTVIGNKFFPKTVSQGDLRLAVRNDAPILKSILEKSMDYVTPEELSLISNKWYTQIYDDINIGLNDEERNWLAANKVQRVSMNTNGSAPFEILADNGTLTGISGELLMLVGDMLNIEFELVKNYDWLESFEQIKNKENAILPTVIRNEERQEHMLFTDSYYVQKNVIFAKKEAMSFTNMSHLRGYKIAQLKNDATTEFIRANYPEIEIIEVQNPTEALKAVSSDEADAYIGVLSVTKHHLNVEGITDIGIVGETSITSELSMGINADLPLLASAVNKALNSIPNEEKERIAQKWLAVHVVEKTDYELLINTLIIASLIIGIIIYWYNKLSIEQRKTKEALELNKAHLIELQYQRELIEQSSVDQTNLMNDLEIISAKHQLKNDLLTNIMDNTGHGIVVFSNDLKLVAWNDTFKKMIGVQGQIFKEGIDLTEFYNLEKLQEFKKGLSSQEYLTKLQKFINDRAKCDQRVQDINLRNGTIINVVLRIVADGTIINTYRDVTKERKKENKIKEMALCDGLTGLANRRAFDANMERSIQQFTRTDVPFLLAYLDLDNFKKLNDTVGHNAGDLVLKHVASVIVKHIRDKDVAARLGGDEFAIIFQNTDDIETTANRLEKIVQEINNTKQLGSYDITVGVRAGLARCSEKAITVGEMIEIADQALYKAKENGKGQIFKLLTA